MEQRMGTINSMKSVGGNIRRLIIRERGDVRDKLRTEAEMADAWDGLRWEGVGS